MNLDEFAFVNQQLAGMLKSGIPLEGALRQLCQTMRRGKLQTELQALEADLARGTPLRDALGRRQLPAFYVQMLQVGAASNDLPAVLTLLADYYQRVNFTWTRLKGLMVYPLIVLGASLALSLVIALAYGHFVSETADATGMLGFATESGRIASRTGLLLNLWTPVILLALATAVTVTLLAIPTSRRWLGWKLPAFREARLSNLASSLAMMLQNGCHLNQALGLLRQFEGASPTGRDLEQWQSRLSSGQRKFSEVAAGGKIIPPLFIWLVAASGEDWISGFKHAAEIYYARAAHRTEVLLYAALPVSVLMLGFLIVSQVAPLFRVFIGIMRSLGDMDGIE
jgi:type II secretory pathway component PulF